MKVYDREMFNAQQKLHSLVIIIVIFLIGFFVGFITNQYASPNQGKNQIQEENGVSNIDKNKIEKETCTKQDLVLIYK